MGLERVENVLDYLISLDRKKPLEQMNNTETMELLKMLGWRGREDFEFTRHKLLRLVKFFS